MIEFSRRHDCKFNIWEMSHDDGWIIIDVLDTHSDALEAVRAVRTNRRDARDEREAEPVAVAYNEPQCFDA